ncbi:transporter substrate-binding domain-containing protein [Ectopseudomonas mendocina]|nr:transporter substrate-binding domain-containing protein [Pseudomonas mendocina]TXR41167.1 transporter substrate-binding domain-containing protein [Pseudomonas mendocina]
MITLPRKHIAVALFSAWTALSASWANADDLLAQIQSSKRITIATEARYAPFEFVEGGKMVGYDIDLMNYVLADLPGVKLKHLDLPWQGVLPGLDRKKFDFVVSAATVNKARAEQFAFTIPIADATVKLLKREGDDSIKSLDDLNGKIVGSQTGSGQILALQAFDKQLKAEGKPGLKELRQYIAYDEAYADLAAGRLDGVAQALPNIGPLLKARPGLFATLPDPLGPKTYFAWVGRKDADSASLVKFFNDRLVRANQDGTMQKLQQKWFGFTMDLPTESPEPEI